MRNKIIPTDPEPWLRGPVPGIPALLQPVAHALIQAREEVTGIMDGFPEERLWDRPAGLASPGFHLQHLAGVLDRLFTYARKESLTADQLTELSSEGQSGPAREDLVSRFDARIELALEQLRNTPEAVLLDPREVGRKRLPSNVIGLLVHAAEHTQRHTGQLLVTARTIAPR
ncbi:MAG TPA: DinB family protein [Puia sp.]|nr:DinB family protein [Puia sp.]